MLLQGLCVYNYNHICEVLQIKTLTKGMTAALHRPSAENNVSEEIITTIMDQPRPQGAFPCKVREKRPGDEVDNGQFNRETTTMGKKKENQLQLLLGKRKNVSLGGSLSGRRSKGKGKGIRARDHFTIRFKRLPRRLTGW